MRDFGLDDVDKLLDLVTGFNVERVETARTHFSARGFDVTNFHMDGLGLPFTSGDLWAHWTWRATSGWWCCAAPPA